MTSLKFAFLCWFYPTVQQQHRVGFESKRLSHLVGTFIQKLFAILSLQRTLPPFARHMSTYNQLDRTKRDFCYRRFFFLSILASSWRKYSRLIRNKSKLKISELQLDSPNYLKLSLFGMLKLASALQFIVTNAYFSVACNIKISISNNELQC